MPIKAKEQWREMVPEIYTWLDNVKLRLEGPEAGSHHLIIAATDDKEGADTAEVKIVSKIDSSLKDQLLETLKKMGIRGKTNPIQVILNQTVYAVVFGTALNVTAKQKGQQIGLDAAKLLSDIEVTGLNIYACEGIDSLDVFSGLAAGWYKVVSFKGKANKPKLPERLFLVDCHYSEKALQESRDLNKAIILSRFVEDAPGNWFDPEAFAQICRDIAKETGAECKIRSGREIKEMGMGSFYSVSQGSSVPAQFIEFKIKGKNPQKTVTLVGKGLTFDAGGLSLKPAIGMDEMKYDMCGGASVLACAYYLAKHQPPYNVVCLIGAAENLIGEKATKPGDVVTSLSGKTIEILNTDAEGRLVLADLLHYAVSEHKPDLLLDIATLTGAVLVALGSCGCALLSNKQQTADYLLACAKKAGEPVWQLPIWPELPQELKSSVADLQNITSSSVKAGTLTAAAFLSEFVGKTAWGHFDIAGTGWSNKATGYPHSGSSGFSVKMLIQACLDFEG